MKGRHTGSPAYVLGNGPSLADVRLERLNDQTTITCNEGILHFPSSFRPMYWTVEDVLDWQQFRNAFDAVQGVTKIVPDDLNPPLRDAIVVPFERRMYGEAGPRAQPYFGTEPPFFWGATVSYLMIQLAVWFGCTPIYLLGQDFSWDWAGETTGGEHIRTVRDRNHFSTDYWPTGTLSFPPSVPMMRVAFEAARDYAGVPIINLTRGTKLDVFPCEDRPELYDQP